MENLNENKNDETIKLITLKNEKNNLSTTLEKLGSELKNEKYENIYDAYIELLNNESITNREIKESINNNLLNIMFYCISPIFGIINLIGIFQIILINKSVLQVFKNAFSIYFTLEINENTNIT